MTNLGKWAHHYRGVTQPQHYGDSDSYRLGAEWLADCPIVEDWGCGLGWFAQFLGPDQIYRGIDGTKSRFATVIADLETYKSETSGIFMRHVLEHNYEWRKVLDNALASFRDRMFLAMFTLWQPKDVVELRFEEDYGVPTLGFAPEVIAERLDDAGTIWKVETIASPQTIYGTEHLFRIER